MAAEPGFVDSHVHLLPDRLARRVRAFFEQHITQVFAYPLDHAAVVAMHQAAGIDTIWSFPYAHKAGVARGMNLASAEIARKHSSEAMTIIGGATVHPRDAEPAEVVREAVEGLGLRVLKLHCSVGDFAPDDPALAEVWEYVSRHRIPVVVHAGHAVSGHTAGAELDPLERVAQCHPDARIVIAHAAHPHGLRALDVVEQYPSVYADLTPVVSETVALPRERVERLAHKLLLGTDAPNTTLSARECIDHIKRWHLSTEAEAAILGANARRLMRAVV